MVNLYIILAPFAPNAWLWWQTKHGERVVQLAQQLQKPPDPVPRHRPNQLIIPAITLDQPVYDGTNMYATLAKGIWRYPLGSTPDKGGNTVLLGHRFTYTNPRGVFYFLNKVQNGDELGVIWNDTTYRYRVTETLIVPPSQTSILAQTAAPTLTVYTCTPLWWPHDRLVIIAHPEVDR